MGIIDRLRKRRVEERIGRKAKKLYGRRDPHAPDPVDVQVERVKSRGRRIGRRMYQETQNRKGQGKEYLHSKVKKIFFGSESIIKSGYRELMFDSSTQTRKKIKGKKK